MNNRILVKKINKRTILIAGVVLTLIIIGIVSVLVIFPFLHIRYLGITLKPTSDIPIHQVTYYIQRDTQWQEDMIGGSSRTIGSEGCLITCASIAASDLENKSITPQAFNQMMTQVDGYEGASLLWYKMQEAIPSLSYRTSRVFSSDTIESDLKNGLMPIVKVKMHGVGAIHWVLIIGAQNGEFMIADPLNQDKQPIPLATHGRVYAYRVITKA